MPVITKQFVLDMKGSNEVINITKKISTALSKLKIDNGILTDQNNKTSIENVFAAGDVANFFHPLYEENIRLESWKHAQNHGIAAGKNITGIKTSSNKILKSNF